MGHLSVGTCLILFLPTPATQYKVCMVLKVSTGPHSYSKWYFPNWRATVETLQAAIYPYINIWHVSLSDWSNTEGINFSWCCFFFIWEDINPCVALCRNDKTTNKQFDLIRLTQISHMLKYPPRSVWLIRMILTVSQILYFSFPRDKPNIELPHNNFLTTLFFMLHVKWFMEAEI